MTDSSPSKKCVLEIVPPSVTGGAWSIRTPMNDGTHFDLLYSQYPIEVAGTVIDTQKDKIKELEAKLREVQQLAVRQGNEIRKLERNRDALEAELKRFVAHAARGVQPPGVTQEILEAIAFEHRSSTKFHNGVLALRAALRPVPTKPVVLDEWVDIGEAGKPVGAGWDANGSPIETGECQHDLQHQDKTVRMHQQNGLVGWKCTVCDGVWMPAVSEEGSRP